MKYFFLRVATTVFLVGVIAGCGKSVDGRLSLQLVSGCDADAYNTLVSEIDQYCVSATYTNSSNAVVTIPESCATQLEKAALAVNTNEVREKSGADAATVKIMVEGKVVNGNQKTVIARGVSAPVKLDPSIGDAVVSIPFFRVVALSSTSTWNGFEFMMIARDDSPSVGSCAKLPFESRGHTATVFNSGHVLVTGTSAALPADVTMAAYLIDSYSGDFLPIQPTNTTTEKLHRTTHTASLLSNGKTVIVGGVDFCSCSPQPCLCLFIPLKDITVLDTTRMNDAYEPTEGYNHLSVVSNASALSNGRSGHEATVLQGTQILINDGSSNRPVLLSGDNLVGSGITLTTPANDPFTVSPATIVNVILYGSAVSPLNVGRLVQDSTTPTTFTFTASGMSLPVRNHPIGLKTATNKALFFGGLADITAGPHVVNIEYFPRTSSWVACGLTVPAAFPTSGYTATPIYDSTGATVRAVFVAGGNSSSPRSTYYLVPNQKACPDFPFNIYKGPNMIMPRTGHTASLLADGRLLLVGGTSSSTVIASNAAVASSAEVIAFDLLSSSW